MASSLSLYACTGVSRAPRDTPPLPLLWGPKWTQACTGSHQNSQPEHSNLSIQSFCFQMSRTAILLFRKSWTSCVNIRLFSWELLTHHFQTSYYAIFSHFSEQNYVSIFCISRKLSMLQHVTTKDGESRQAAWSKAALMPSLPSKGTPRMTTNPQAQCMQEDGFLVRF